MRPAYLSFTIFILAALITFTAEAEIPDALKGKWIVDGDPTEKLMKSSPNWTADKERLLPTIITILSLSHMEFTEDKFLWSVPGNTQTFEITDTTRAEVDDKDQYTLQGKAGDKPVTLICTVLDEVNITVSGVGGGQVKFVAWKRGEWKSGDSIFGDVVDKIMKNKKTRRPAKK